MSRNAPFTTPDTQCTWQNNPGSNWQNNFGSSQHNNPGTSHSYNFGQNCQNNNGSMWSNRPGPSWQSNPGPSWQSNPGPSWHSNPGPSWHDAQGPNWQDNPVPRGQQGPPMPGAGGGWSNGPGPYPEPRWRGGGGPPPWQTGPTPSRAMPSQQRGVVKINSFASNNGEPMQRGRDAKGSNADKNRKQSPKPPPDASTEKLADPSEASCQVPQKKNTFCNSESSEKGRNLARQDASTLRVITSTIHGAKKWNKSKYLLGVTLFEVYGIVDSATLKDSSATGKEFLLRDEGSSMPCIFYEIDRQLPRLVRGQWYRCVGKFKPTEKFQCFSVRPTTISERKMGSSAMRQAESYLLKLGREP